MRKRSFLFVSLCALAASAALPVAAQSLTNTVKLFDASVIGGTVDPNSIVTVNNAQPVASASVFVDCTQAGSSKDAKIIGPVILGGSFFVDNFFQITTTPNAGPSTTVKYTCGYETNNMGCFNGFNNGAWNDPANLGQPAMNHYAPVPPVDVAASLASGPQALQVTLMDAGGIYGHSEINLTTTCAIPPVTTLCHKPGTPAEKTMYNVPNPAVPGHLGHGDKLGACPAK